MSYAFSTPSNVCMCHRLMYVCLNYFVARRLNSYQINFIYIVICYLILHAHYSNISISPSDALVNDKNIK